MKSLRRIGSVLLVVGLAISLVGLQAQSEIDITGYYSEQNGEFFRITRNGENVYQVLWRQNAGDWIGVAIRDGDNLAIGWHRSDGANLGVSFYKIGKNDKGPTLIGGWTAYPGSRVVRDSPAWSRKL